MEEDKNGWWDAPAAERWLCPECKVATPVEDWKDHLYYCDDCGEHEGRMCPNCDSVFDHVWGAGQILNGDADVQDGTGED